ncbi:MAG TPA: S8 family serine peptidase [Verrucomicrobiae bacterium]|nr:S8 family serine peptidase [Verrucomicrobiae bacterium]
MTNYRDSILQHLCCRLGRQRGAVIGFHLMLVLSALGGTATNWENKVDAQVWRDAAAGETEFLVFLSEQADVRGATALRTKPEKHAHVLRRLQEVAHRTQAPILKALEERGLTYRAFWIVNMIWVRGDFDAVQSLSQLPEVARILPNSTVHTQEPMPTLASMTTTANVEWNIVKIHAPDVWALGYTGQGVVVGSQDTGVQWDHPALVNQYRGWDGTNANHNYNWHDAIHSGTAACGVDSRVPCDGNGHGTHTLGVAVGDDGLTNHIGVAPGAKWMACRCMDDLGNGTPATYTECFEWFMNPTDLNGQNPDPSKAPDVINNSWVCTTSQGCLDPLILSSVVNNVRAAGIVVVAAAGNDGPGCSTITTPAAIYDAAITVGATGTNDVIEDYSGRGPVTVDGSNRIKPDVCAPGYAIRSSKPPSTYSVYGQTSNSGPHVAGLVALLLSAYPELRGQVDAIERLIERSAVPLTTTEGCGGLASTNVPNNTYGWGRIDALAAFDLAQKPLDQDFECGSLDITNTTVSNPDSSSPSFTLVPRYNGADPLGWWWMYFSATGLANKTPTFHASTVGNSIPFDNNTRWVYSYDQVNWQFFTSGTATNGVFSFSNSIPFSSDKVYVATAIPYGPSKTDALINSIKNNPSVLPTRSADTNLVVGRTLGTAGGGYTDDLGRTVAAQNLYGFEVTDSSVTGPKTKIVIMSGNHSGEPPGTMTVQGLVNFLVSDDPRMQQLRRVADFYVYPQVDPEGRAAGYYISTPQNPTKNHNRYWNNPAGFTEITIIENAMKADTGGAVDYFFDFHSEWQPDEVQPLATDPMFSSPYANLLVARDSSITMTLYPYDVSSFAYGWAASTQGLNAVYTTTVEMGTLAGAQQSTYDHYGQDFALAFYDLLVTADTNQPPIASFTASPTDGPAPLTVTFTNTSVGIITNCLWDFGDTATTNTLAVAVSHTYSAGTYPVTLVASGPGGVSTNTCIDCIVVTNPPPPSGSYWQAVTNASPIAYWRLNETNGATVAVDFFGSHNGTISASVTPGVSGPRNPSFPGFESSNTAMQLNYTTGSYLTMPTLNLNTNTVTITGWINPTGAQAGWTGIAFCRGGSTCVGLNFGPGSIANELRYTWNNSRWDQSTGLAVPTGQWSFVALVVTPTNGTIYMGTDGVLNSFTDTASEPSQAFDSSLLIGYDPSSGSRLFRGVIDEIAIYNHSLTPTQIQQLYTSALTVPPPPLTPFQTWQFAYFNCTNCPRAAPDADPFGKGMSNTDQFLAGLDPTNPSSVFRITSVVADSNNNVLITWSTAGVRTNAVQAASGDTDGNYSNNFADISSPPHIIIPVGGDVTANYLDVGGATNSPSRYYRIRLVP